MYVEQAEGLGWHSVVRVETLALLRVLAPRLRMHSCFRKGILQFVTPPRRLATRARAAICNRAAFMSFDRRVTHRWTTAAARTIS